MNPESKNKSLVSIIIFLLITNVVMLIFFLVLNKPVQRNMRGRDQNGMSGMLQKDVGFTRDQLDTYQVLRKEQLDSIHILFDEVRKAKMNFYNLIYTPNVADSTLISAADEIAVRQKNLDLHMINHFKKVRNICSPDQVQKFDSSIKKIIARMVGKSGRNPNK
jgi:protein CpxP